MAAAGGGTAVLVHLDEFFAVLVTTLHVPGHVVDEDMGDGLLQPAGHVVAGKAPENLDVLTCNAFRCKTEHRIL